MSFETGKKLGLTASLILIIVPIVIVVLYGVLLASVLSSLASTVSGSTAASSSALLGLGFLSGIVASCIALLVGIILLLVAMHNLSQYYGDPVIFKSPLFGVITQVVGSIVLFGLAFAFIFISASSTATGTTTPPSFGITIALGIVGLIVGSIIINVVAGVLYMRGFNRLGDKSGVHGFNTTGLLLLVGFIVPFVGTLIAWIGLILAAVAFNSLQPKVTAPSTVYYPTQPSPTATTVQNKNCAYCGAPNNLDAAYCGACGKQLQ